MRDGVVRESLHDAGFTQYEADAYLALVEQGSMAAIEVAQASGVPKSRVYDVLRDLEERNLVETYEQSSLQARALDPQTVVDDLRDQAERFAETADELEDLWERPSIGDYDVTLVKRLETVIERAKEFIRGADNEAYLALSPEQFDALRPVLHEAIGRDIIIKVSLYPAADGSAPDLDDFDFDGVATEVCYRDLRAPFVALVDQAKVCFSPQPESGYEFGIVADNQPLAYVFQWYYLTSLWEEWQIAYSVRRTEPPIRYVNVRQCVVDIAPLYHEGATISVTVDGYETESGAERRISGTIVDLVYSGKATNDAYPALSEVSGQVTICVDTGEEICTVGGQYATVEHLQLRRLTVESIDRPSNPSSDSERAD